MVPANPAADYTDVPLARVLLSVQRALSGWLCATLWRLAMQDWSIAFGLRGDLSDTGRAPPLDGWHYDLSAGFGHNSIDFFMHNTINPQARPPADGHSDFV